MTETKTGDEAVTMAASFKKLSLQYDCDHFVTGKYWNKEEDIGANRMNRMANMLELRRIVGKPLQ